MITPEVELTRRDPFYRGALFLGFLIVVALATAWSLRPTPARQAEPTPVAIVDNDSWVLKRLEYADKICGPVPFEIQATRDSFHVICGRPENVGRIRVPKPPARPVEIPVVP